MTLIEEEPPQRCIVVVVVNLLISPVLPWQSCRLGSACEFRRRAAIFHVHSHKLTSKQKSYHLSAGHSHWHLKQEVAAQRYLLIHCNTWTWELLYHALDVLSCVGADWQFRASIVAGIHQGTPSLPILCIDCSTSSHKDLTMQVMVIANIQQCCMVVGTDTQEQVSSTNLRLMSDPDDAYAATFHTDVWQMDVLVYYEKTLIILLLTMTEDHDQRRLSHGGSTHGAVNNDEGMSFLSPLMTQLMTLIDVNV